VLSPPVGNPRQSRLWCADDLIRCCLVGVLAVSAAALSAISPAQAAHPKKKHPAAAAPATQDTQAARSLGQFDAWAAYASQDKTGKVCYPRRPAAEDGAGRVRAHAADGDGDASSGGEIANVVSFVEGYALKEGSDVALDVGGSKFELFTKDDSAWARTADLDKTIVARARQSQTGMVKGVSQKGRRPPTPTRSPASPRRSRRSTRLAASSGNRPSVK